VLCFHLKVVVEMWRRRFRTKPAAYPFREVCRGLYLRRARTIQTLATPTRRRENTPNQISVVCRSVCHVAPSRLAPRSGLTVKRDEVRGQVKPAKYKILTPSWTNRLQSFRAMQSTWSCRTWSELRHYVMEWLFTTCRCRCSLPGLEFSSESSRSEVEQG
jgi:hypothetical protein